MLVIRGPRVSDLEPVAVSSVALEIVIRSSREVDLGGTGVPE